MILRGKSACVEAALRVYTGGVTGIPHTRPGVWPADVPAGRAASLIEIRDPAGCRVALLGLGDDLGVRLNGGRAGAREGPAAFRGALARYGVAAPAGWDWPRVYDAGDVQPAEGADAEALAETHRRITDVTGAILEMGMLPVAIGGGHDLTFAFARAAAARWPGLGGVYFDPHLDVRETAGSGMPFRRLIEQCGVREVRNYGFNPLVNTREHVQWFREHGGRIEDGILHSTGELPGRDLFVSFDLDVVDGAHAPGVSAVNPCGWSAAQATGAVAAAARHPGVRCFDIMELCPGHDAGGRTARLAAHLFLTFLRGLGERRA
jgi:formiminoglutamase